MLKSPDAVLLLLTCPVLLEDNNVIDEVIPLALIISELNEKMSGLISESLLCLESDSG